MGFGLIARGETGQDPEWRPRTPDTLKERGRDELIGTYDSEAAKEKGSEVGMELKELVADMSADVGATRICDCDMGVSDDSDSLSAAKYRS